jgi:LAO/AO transport system kinase
VANLWEAIRAHRAHLTASGELEARRRARLAEEISSIVAERVRAGVRRTSAGRLEQLLARVERRELSPYAAADALLAGGVTAGPTDGLGGEAGR